MPTLPKQTRAATSHVILSNGTSTTSSLMTQRGTENTSLPQKGAFMIALSLYKENTQAPPSQSQSAQL